MSQTPEEWMLSAIAELKPDIESRSLRPAALKPYQEAFLRELLAHEHETVTVMVPLNGRGTYSKGVDIASTHLTAFWPPVENHFSAVNKPSGNDIAGGS